MRAGLLMDPDIPTQQQLEQQAPRAGAYVQVRASLLAEGFCGICVGSVHRSQAAQLADKAVTTPGPRELTWQQDGLVMHQQCPVAAGHQELARLSTPGPRAGCSTWCLRVTWARSSNLPAGPPLPGGMVGSVLPAACCHTR